MNAAVFFVAIFLGVILHAFLVRWVASHFVAMDTSNVAGFSFVVGMAYMVSSRINDEQQFAVKVAVSCAYLLALTVIWYLFFKREKANG